MKKTLSGKVLAQEKALWAKVKRAADENPVVMCHK